MAIKTNKHGGDEGAVLGTPDKSGGTSEARRVEKKEFSTSSGIPLKAVYHPEDIKGLDYQRDLGSPGEYPFTRGVYPNMYRDQVWTFRQYAGYGAGEDANERFKFLLANGQTGLSVALDLPTQMGLDSDDPRAAGEVGRLGVAINTLADMESVFDGIPLDRVSTSFTINATAAIILAMYLTVAERQGVPLDQVRGTVQNDMLKEYVARGAYIFPPKPSIRLTGDIIEYCINNAPKFNTVSVASGHMYEAGASPIEAVSYMLLNGLVYLEEVMRRGYSVDQIAPLFTFLLEADTDFFESIARQRVCRRWWARTLKERYGAQNPRSMMVRMHIGGDCGWMTLQQPLNNIARIAINCLANVLGGTQSMQLPSFDEAYAIPTEEAARNSLMVQAIVAHEIGITDVVDPLAGSYFFEWLTDEVERRIEETMEKVNITGGIVQWVETGQLQREIGRQAYLRQRKIDTGEEIRVGVNKYLVPEDRLAFERDKMFEIRDQETHRKQLQRLHEVKAKRDPEAVSKALARLKAAAGGADNVMPRIMDAVRAYATVGEMVSTLKGVWGAYKPPQLI